jgi:phosphonate transport system substrate-binding protein
MLRRTFFAATLAASTLAVSGTSLSPAIAEEKTEINFGIISTESTANLKTTWLPFLEAMEESTGLKVNAFFAPDYAGVIEGMRFDKVQVAWFGNKSAMEAVDRADAEVFAQTVDNEGNPGYWSLLLAHKDSPINTLEDVLKCDGTLNFGIGDPNSTSGFLVPTTYIFAKHNVEPSECFKTVRNANHEANALAAAKKQADVVTNNTENMRRLKLTRPEDHANLKVIWQSPLIPSDPLVWRKDLDDDVKSKLYTFIMTYGRIGSPEDVAEARAVLDELQWAPFRPSSDAQLYPIRTLEINKDMLRVRGDDKLSDEEKQAKLAALQAQANEIEALTEQVPNM